MEKSRLRSTLPSRVQCEYFQLMDRASTGALGGREEIADFSFNLVEPGRSLRTSEMFLHLSGLDQEEDYSE